MIGDVKAILVAEDDQDDRELTREAFAVLALPNPLAFFKDGADLLDHLRDCAAMGQSERLPGLVLLDLNMPRVCGREALRQIRADARLRHLPIVVLSTSKAERDRSACDLEGADLFLTKPPCFREFVDLLRGINHHFSTVSVELTSKRQTSAGSLIAI